jgi:hypothetical protein
LGNPVGVGRWLIIPGTAQDAPECLPVAWADARQHVALVRRNRAPCALQKVGAGGRQVQSVGAAVGGGARALDMARRLQAVDHLHQAGTLDGQRLRDPRLRQPRIGGDDVEHRELRGRDVELPERAAEVLDHPQLGPAHEIADHAIEPAEADLAESGAPDAALGRAPALREPAHAGGCPRPGAPGGVAFIS